MVLTNQCLKHFRKRLILSVPPTVPEQVHIGLIEFGLGINICGSTSGSTSKESACNKEIWVQNLGLKDPLEKEMANHSSILAWRILCTEEPGGLQSMGLQIVGQD